MTIWRLVSCSVGEDNPLRQELLFRCGSADWPSAASLSGTANGRWRLAGVNPVRCRRHTDGGGGGRACGFVAVACPPWLTPIAASASRDVLLRVQRVQFPEKRGTISPFARYG